MPAARYWRAISVEAHGGGDLELSALHVYGEAGRLDAGASLTSTFAPSAGTLAHLQDEDFGTTATFAKAAINAASFALVWDFGTPVEVWGVRAGGPAAERFLKSLILQYSDDGVTWGAYAANLGDFVYLGSSVLTPAPTAEPWMYSQRSTYWLAQTAAGSRDWRAAAMSPDGQKMLAVAYGNYPWFSDDGGATWVAQTAAGSRDWFGAAMSADGQKTLAVVYGGYLWFSDDGGATWVAQTAAGSRDWVDAAMSADGQKILAVAYRGYPWFSDDGGATWVAQTAAGSRDWSAAAMSADGQKILAVARNGGYLWFSDDGGATWVAQTAAGSQDWFGAAMSADGQKILAVAYRGYPWFSDDGGATWVAQTAAGSRDWEAAAMSADGQKILAVARNGNYPWFSDDGGATWVAQTAAGSRDWSAAAMSADGQKILAVAGGDDVRRQVVRDPMFAEPPLHTVAYDATEFFASSPIPEFSATGLPEPMPWRDMEFDGKGKVAGTVKEKNTPANTPLRRRVRLVREIDGLQIRETWSDAITGAYEFLQIDERHKYTVISYDYATFYRAVIADNLTPETLI